MQLDIYAVLFTTEARPRPRQTKTVQVHLSRMRPGIFSGVELNPSLADSHGREAIRVRVLPQEICIGLQPEAAFTDPPGVQRPQLVQLHI